MTINAFGKANELYRNNEYDKALTLYLEFVDEIKDSDVYKALTLYNISVCYIKLKDYNKALEYTNMSLDLCRKGIAYFNKGYIYAMLEDYNKAYINFKIALIYNPYDEECIKSIQLIERHNDFKANKTITSTVTNKIATAKQFIEIALETGDKEMFFKYTSELKDLGVKY